MDQEVETCRWCRWLMHASTLGLTLPIARSQIALAPTPGLRFSWVWSTISNALNSCRTTSLSSWPMAVCTSEADWCVCNVLTNKKTLSHKTNNFTITVSNNGGMQDWHRINSLLFQQWRACFEYGNLRQSQLQPPEEVECCDAMDLTILGENTTGGRFVIVSYRHYH